MTDPMLWTASALLVLYVVTALGIRIALQVRRTGDSGFRGFTGARGSSEWWASVGFLGGMLVLGAGIVGALAGLPAVLDHVWVRAVGLVVAAVGMVGTFLVQLAMGDSWRIGVDTTERTDLVTGGPFGVVRNPIFTAMLIACAGFTLAVPNPVVILGWLLLLAAVEFEVRVVEEPHLLRQHGESYRSYLATVGRFLPGVGRSTSPPRR